MDLVGDGNPNFGGKWYGPNPKTIITTEQRRSNALIQFQRYKEDGTLDEVMSKVHEGHKKFFSTEEGMRVRRRNGINTHKLLSGNYRTSIEEKMAVELARRGLRYEEQYVLDEIFIPDFMLIDYGIIIECDGDYWHSRPDIVKRDNRKNAYYRKKQIPYFRFLGIRD